MEIDAGGQKEWRKIVGDTERRPPQGTQSEERNDGPSNPIPDLPHSGESSEESSDEESDEDDSSEESEADSDEEQVTRLAKEGGAQFMEYLLEKAVPMLKTAHDTPKEWNFRDIMRLPERERKEWIRACIEEIEALKQRKVFELTSLPSGRKTIKNRWVFDLKSDGRKRARLVAKGFTQVEGIDYTEIFSPVVRFESVRIMLALAALENWFITAIDVKTAFLYGKLDEEIYMEQPEGFKIQGKEQKVFRLLRAIYGLKQASNAWYKELVESAKTLGFKRLSTDTGIFIHRATNDEFVIMIAYVDDVLFVGPNRKLVIAKKEEFKLMWECRDLGEPSSFLQMQIRRQGNIIRLDQTAYLKMVLERFEMMDCRVADTPMVEGYKPLPNEGPVNAQLRQQYQSVIGSLLYLMLGTRPDITYAVTKMAQHAANPTQEHLKKALYICRYLRGTMDYSMVLNGSDAKGLIGYSDSDHAADPMKR